MTRSEQDLRNEIAGRIGYRLRMLRRSRGWKLHDVALLLGHANPGAVGRHERGLRCPSLWTLAQYADVYGVTVTDIVSVVDQRFCYEEAS